ncbi:amidase signature domain-containing protein [Stachybotrys elegans]|uniref:amidase n=1 Tax=Stachybotrys elegans TaxID=80388 RepID=A0A8K0WNH9_9HYPO|nr:amidase signature domain-containing protein [Stachybotrys elegans]
MAASWEAAVSDVRAAREASLAKVEPRLQGLPEGLPRNSTGLAKVVLSPRELEITENYTITQLLAALRERKLSVEEVTRAYLRRAALAQAATNCLTGLLWDEAIERARYLDSLPEPKGQLFGLPISTKEHHGMVGDNVTSSASYACWAGKQHNSNLLYDTLWDEGCVFYARTTQPQTIMHLETESNLYGLTVNPFNRDLTPGGSSGGEAAMLGMRASILGVGGDIGGSVRCPCSHVGVYGFKPTLKRISLLGQRGHMAGKEAILPTAGPMALDREALDLFMKVAISAKPWRIDPSLSMQEWTPYHFDRPLKIAVQWWDGVVRPHPPMLRAMKEVSDACKKAGMKIVEWDCEPLNHRKGWEIITSLYWPDGGKEVMGLLNSTGEPILPLTKFIIEEQPSVKDLSQAELWQRCVERDQYREAYARAWNKTAEEDGQEVDVILCPASFGAATPHRQSRYWGYTANWNLLDYPGAVFPVTVVDPSKDPVDTSYIPKTEEDKFVHDMYSPDKYVDAPVSLQLIGRRHHDEKVLAALAEIERAMGR